MKLCRIPARLSAMIKSSYHGVLNHSQPKTESIYLWPITRFNNYYDESADKKILKIKTCHMQVVVIDVGSDV